MRIPRPLKIPVYTQELNKDEIILRTRKPRIRPELLIGLFMICMLLYVFASSMYEGITNPQGMPQALLLGGIMGVIAVLLFFYTAYRVSLYDEIRINRQTDSITHTSMYLLKKSKWLGTLTKSDPFTAVTAVYTTTASELHTTEAVAQIDLSNEQPIQLKYGIDETKAHKTAQQLQTWLPNASPEPHDEKNKSAFNTDLTDTIVKNTATASALWGCVLMIILTLDFVLDRFQFDWPAISIFFIAGITPVFLQHAKGNLPAIFIISLWLTYLFPNSQTGGQALPVILTMYLLFALNHWRLQNRLQKQNPHDERFTHRHNDIAQILYPYTGLALASIALLGWFFAQSISFPLATVQDAAVHTAVFGFALGTASWLSDYPHKFASITASILGGITIILWLINQFSGAI